MPTAASLPNTCAQTIVIASHCVGLTLPGMIELPGSFSGMRDLADAAARARGEPAHVVGDLHQRAASVLSAPCSATSASWAASAANLFGAVTNGRPVSSAICCAPRVRELRVRVEAGADGGAAERELVAPRQRVARSRRRRVVELRDPAGDLLAERERRRVLQVRAADLDDVRERLRLARRASSRSCATRGQQLVHRSARPRRCASRSGRCRSTTARC